MAREMTAWSPTPGEICTCIREKHDYRSDWKTKTSVPLGGKSKDTVRYLRPLGTMSAVVEWNGKEVTVDKSTLVPLCTALLTKHESVEHLYAKGDK